MVWFEWDGGICVELVTRESVTTSVGDLHKAPFQSCSVRRTGREGQKTATSTKKKKKEEDTKTHGGWGGGVGSRRIGRKMRGNKLELVRRKEKRAKERPQSEAEKRKSLTY